jgi:farnesyl diphosphate synthase
MMKTAFMAALDASAAETERLLGTLLSQQPAEGEIGRPERLVDAMRYSALGGGKRLRPFLVVESAALFDVPRDHALMTGAALECIHCYSLIHDDLPAMDNDDLRRGRPTLHRAYDDATAILAGDSLLTFAFDILSRPETHPDSAIRIALVRELARASGLGGMAGGQLLDLAAEGRFGALPVASESAIVTMQSMKTGALLHFACIAGGILGKAPAPERDALSRYGRAVGVAFQIADDLLDVEGDAATVGKATGKDAAMGKATLVSILGVATARERLVRCVSEAEAALAGFGERGAILRDAARFIAAREK